MTFRQAYMEALRRNGWSETEIALGVAAADAEVGRIASEREILLPPGVPLEEFIAHLTRQVALLDALPTGELERELRAGLRYAAKRNKRN